MTTKVWLANRTLLGVLFALTPCYPSSVGAISATFQLVESWDSPSLPDSPRPSELKSLACRRPAQMWSQTYSRNPSKPKGSSLLSLLSTVVCLGVVFWHMILRQSHQPSEDYF